MPIQDDEYLADLISEIFDEVSEVESSFGTIHLKHFKQLEMRRIFSKTNKYISEAEKKGVRKEKEVLEDLIKDDIWSEDLEKEMEQKRIKAQEIQDSISSIKLPSKKNLEAERIKKLQGEIGFMLKEKLSLMGITAEIYAERKIQKDFFNSIAFLDKECTKCVSDSIDSLDFVGQQEVQDIQQNFFKKFDDRNISKSVLSPFFTPYLPYSENILDLFGKPMKDLTTFQIRMVTYGRSFLNIFKNCTKDIPNHVAKDPELLMSFYEASKNESNKGAGSTGSGGTTYFGATKDDLTALSSEDEKVVSLNKELKKEGGKLDMKQMMKLHGI